MSNEVKALHSLSQNHLDLFSLEDRNDLGNMLSQPTTDLGETISGWIGNHPHLRPTYLELLKQSNTPKAAGGGGGDPLSPEEEQQLKQEIINTIRVSSPQNKPSESK